MNNFIKQSINFLFRTTIETNLLIIIISIVFDVFLHKKYLGSKSIWTFQWDVKIK
jgi:hypothetical protein